MNSRSSGQVRSDCFPFTVACLRAVLQSDITNLRGTTKETL